MADEPLFFSVRCKNPECACYITTAYFTTSDDSKTIGSQMKKVLTLEIRCHKCGHVTTYGYRDLGIVGRKIETADSPPTAGTEEPQEPQNQ
jgi:hypothetical protein